MNYYHPAEVLYYEARDRFGDTDEAREWLEAQVRRAAVAGEQWAADVVAKVTDDAADMLAQEFTRHQAAKGEQWAVRLLAGEGTAEDDEVARMLFGAAFERTITG